MQSTPMKMRSTYISLLIGGLMLIFYVNSSRLQILQKPVLKVLSVKTFNPDAAKLVPTTPLTAPPANNNGDQMPPVQTRPAFSFFKIVLTNIAPGLKHLL